MLNLVVQRMELQKSRLIEIPMKAMHISALMDASPKKKILKWLKHTGAMEKMQTATR